MTRARPVTTVRPGDLVTIDLTGRAMNRTHRWAGTVTGVDSVALRIAASWSQFTLSVHPAEGERVIPWGRIASVHVHPAEEVRDIPPRVVIAPPPITRPIPSGWCLAPAARRSG